MQKQLELLLSDDTLKGTGRTSRMVERAIELRDTPPVKNIFIISSVPRMVMPKKVTHFLANRHFWRNFGVSSSMKDEKGNPYICGSNPHDIFLIDHYSIFCYLRDHGVSIPSCEFEKLLIEYHRYDGSSLSIETLCNCLEKI